ncbi:MAG: DUF1329 domain-containing protein [Desulfobacterales bacterium]
MLHFKKSLVLACMFLLSIHGISSAQQVNVGDIITPANVDQYTDYLPPFVVQFIKDGFGVVSPDVTSPIYVGDVHTPLAPESFRKESEKNSGKVTLNPEDMKLTGFEYCGIPFPDVEEPNKVEKILCNYYYRWRSDDYYYKEPFATTSKRKGGRITCYNTTSALVRYVGRTAPGLETNLDNPNDLFWVQMNRFLQPSFKNLRTLQWRYLDPKKDDDMWSYIPTLRRTLRMVSSERANPINGTPLTYDDFMGFDGKLNKFTYKLSEEKKVIGNINMDAQAHIRRYPDLRYESPLFHGPEYPYGIADVYIIDVIPKDPTYPESKKVLYMNKLNYMNVYSIVYDKRGQPWKGLVNNVSETKTVQGEKGYFNAQMDFDMKTGYWMNIFTNGVTQDSGLPSSLFDPGIFHTWQ